MSTHEGPEADTDTDPSVVTSAVLRRLVDLARSQPVPPRRRDAESLHAAFLVARQARRRRLATYAAASVALAAALAALVVTRLDLFIRTGPMDHVTQDMRPGPAAPLAATPTLTAAARVITDQRRHPEPDGARPLGGRARARPLRGRGRRAPRRRGPAAARHRAARSSCITAAS